jgi:hypothetical protein
VDAALSHLARAARIVVFAGLPGTGKSFLVNRLAHGAHDAGRAVHLLQWDVARPAFEASAAGRRYPMRAGVTHPVVRKAAGVWARSAIAAWHARCPDPAHLLVGEAPLVGHRFVELARPASDEAELLLAEGEFVIAVPSPEMRRRLAQARRERLRGGGAGREREDALPALVDALWDDVRRAAARLGFRGAGGPGAHGAGPANPENPETPDPPYDPVLYEAVYRTALGRRRASVLRLHDWRAGGPASAYDFAFAPHDLVPAGDEAGEFIRAVEARYSDLAALEAEMARWYDPASSAD